MADLTYEDLEFEPLQGKVRIRLFRTYWFEVPADELARAQAQVSGLHSVTLQDKKAQRFEFLLSEGLKRLRGPFGKPTVYIHAGSGVPLVGTNEFGIVDRDTNLLEVKPVTGCNLSCTYCSVDEGDNAKAFDYVVEADYLVAEFRKLAALKHYPVEANIGPQGDPLVYPRLVELVRGLASTPNVAVVSMNTNGTLLSPRLIDDLAAAGLTRINWSLNSLEEKKLSQIAGRPYPKARVLELISYAKSKVSILIAPVVVPGSNDTDEDLDALIELAKTLPEGAFPRIGFQNFLNYERGRNPTTERPMDEFYAILRRMETRHGIPLCLQESAFQIVRDKTLQKPFHKGDWVGVDIVLPGRYPYERVGVAQGRCVTVVSKRPEERLRVKLVRDKHNIFRGLTD